MLTYDEALDTTSLPATTAFAIANSGEAPLTVSAVATE